MKVNSFRLEVNKLFDPDLVNNAPFEAYKELLETKYKWLDNPDNEKHGLFKLVKNEYDTLIAFYKHIDKLMMFANSEISDLEKDKNILKAQIHKLKHELSLRLYNKNDINRLA